MSDQYLLKAVTLRIIDRMLCEAKSRQTKKYFLTWTSNQGHDMDEWVGIANTKEELKKLYEKTKDEDGEYYEDTELRLVAYDYTEEYGFVPINVI